MNRRVRVRGAKHCINNRFNAKLEEVTYLLNKLLYETTCDGRSNPLASMPALLTGGWREERGETDRIVLSFRRFET